jgi:hypothetical protein
MEHMTLINFNGTYILDYNGTKLNNMTKTETKDSDLPWHTMDPWGGQGGELDGIGKISKFTAPLCAATIGDRT